MAWRSTCTDSLFSRLAAALAVLLVEAVAAFAQPAPATGRFYLAANEKPTLLTAREASPTLQQQCARIEAAGVVVAIVFRHPDLFDRRIVASTEIRSEGGRVGFARVALPLTSDWAATLGHELEHVLEQIEGVDLAAAARTHAREVWRVGKDYFETRRAQQAGDVVRRELRQRGGATLLAAR